MPFRSKLSLWLARLWLVVWAVLFATVLRDSVGGAHWLAVGSCVLLLLLTIPLTPTPKS